MRSYGILVASAIFSHLAYFGNCADFPSRFKTCKRNDPKLLHCLEEAVQYAFRELKNGIPELRMPSIDPLVVEDIRIDAGTMAVNLNQHYIKPKIVGASTLKVIKSEGYMNDTNIDFAITGLVPKLGFYSKYEFDGKITALAIKGEGDFAWEIFNVTIRCSFSGTTYEKKGKAFIHLDDTGLRYTVGKATFNIDNLFGNEVLSREINRSINENWYEVENELQPSIEVVLRKLIGDYARKLFLKVPYDQLAPPK